MVILLWADQLPSGFENQDEATESRLLYVALTRPEDLLIMTASQPSAFVQQIEASGKAETYIFSENL